MWTPQVPGTGSYAITLYKYEPGVGWGDTAVTCTMEAEANEASDVVNSFTVNPGDEVVVKWVPSVAPAPDNGIRPHYTIEFEGDTEKESLLPCNFRAHETQVRYNPPMGSHISTGGTQEAPSERICPTNGKLKNMRIRLTTDPGTSPDAYRFTLRINQANSDDGEGNPLQVTITANDKTGEDLVHEISISAGDKFCILCEPIETPSADPYCIIGMTFVPDVDGESLVLGGTSDNLDAASTEYNFMQTSITVPWGSQENLRYQLVGDCVFKKLYVGTQLAPGGGKSFTFTPRINGTSPDGGLEVILVEDNIGNDLVNSINAAFGDKLNLMAVPSGSPNCGDSMFSMVSYIAAPLPPKAGGGGTAPLLVAQGLI
ncbi:hypothetical protein ES708_22666 [subsurface metagenome]